MRAQEIIAKKRDGAALNRAEIAFFVDGYTTGKIPDYQASALLMAIYLRGMNDEETAELTQAMAASGRVLDLAGALPPARPTLDKHSTGGVGDKTTLVVVPILAAAGAHVCKMSGRGLGHTGGTLDKLESLPGFRIGLGPDEMLEQVARVGACLAGQTADLAPADGKLYALRDATATVGSTPLIVSSILSKKLAGGAQSFLFDVKAGGGALMETVDDARALARALVDGARRSGRRAVAVLSDMSQPLGRTVGNALEMREAIDLLAGAPDPDPRLRELCLRLAAEGMVLTGLVADRETGRKCAERILRCGAAFGAFREIVAAQGGDVAAVDDAALLLPHAKVVIAVPAARDGYVRSIDARAIGEAVVALGGGRARKEDAIDHSVGAVIHTPVASQVVAGDTLVEVHAASHGQAAAVLERFEAAFDLADAPVPEPELILDVVLG